MKNCRIFHRMNQTPRRRRHSFAGYTAVACFSAEIAFELSSASRGNVLTEMFSLVNHIVVQRAHVKA
jgi:hypothetical protein